MKFAVILAPADGQFTAVLGQHPFFNGRKLVMGGGNTAFPLNIPGINRFRKPVGFKQQPHRGQFLEIRGRRFDNPKTFLPFDKNKTRRNKTVQHLAERVDTGIITIPQRIKLQLHTGLEFAIKDVIADFVINGLGNCAAAHGLSPYPVNASG